MAAAQRKLVHKQFNSPMGLYSQDNVKATLDRELKAFGEDGIEVDENISRPLNLANSAVLRAVEEEEQKVKCETWQRPSRARQRENEPNAQQPHHQQLHHQQLLEQIKTQYLSHHQDITIDRDTVLKINRLATRRLQQHKRDTSWPPAADNASQSGTAAEAKGQRDGSVDGKLKVVVANVHGQTHDNVVHFDEVVCRRHGIDAIREKFNSPTRIHEDMTKQRLAMAQRRSGGGKKLTNRVPKPAVSHVDAAHPHTDTDADVDADDDDGVLSRTPTAKGFSAPETKAADINIGLVAPKCEYYEQLLSGRQQQTAAASKAVEPQTIKRQSQSLERGRGRVRTSALPPLKPRASSAAGRLGARPKVQRRAIKLATEIQITYNETDDGGYQTQAVLKTSQPVKATLQTTASAPAPAQQPSRAAATTAGRAVNQQSDDVDLENLPLPPTPTSPTSPPAAAAAAKSTTTMTTTATSTATGAHGWMAGRHKCAMSAAIVDSNAATAAAIWRARTASGTAGREPAAQLLHHKTVDSSVTAGKRQQQLWPPEQKKPGQSQQQTHIIPVTLESADHANGCALSEYPPSQSQSQSQSKQQSEQSEQQQHHQQQQDLLSEVTAQKIYDDACIYLRSIDLQDQSVAYVPAAITIVPSTPVEEELASESLERQEQQQQQQQQQQMATLASEWSTGGLPHEQQPITTYVTATSGIKLQRQDSNVPRHKSQPATPATPPTAGPFHKPTMSTTKSTTPADTAAAAAAAVEATANLAEKQRRRQGTYYGKDFVATNPEIVLTSDHTAHGPSVDIQQLEAKYANIQKSITEHLLQIDMYMENAKKALRRSVERQHEAEQHVQQAAAEQQLSSSSSSSRMRLGLEPSAEAHSVNAWQNFASRQSPILSLESGPLQDMLRKIYCKPTTSTSTTNSSISSTNYRSANEPDWLTAPAGANPNQNPLIENVPIVERALTDLGHMADALASTANCASQPNNRATPQDNQAKGLRSEAQTANNEAEEEQGEGPVNAVKPYECQHVADVIASYEQLSERVPKSQTVSPVPNYGLQQQQQQQPQQQQQMSKEHSNKALYERRRRTEGGASVLKPSESPAAQKLSISLKQPTTSPIPPTPPTPPPLPPPPSAGGIINTEPKQQQQKQMRAEPEPEPEPKPKPRPESEPLTFPPASCCSRSSSLSQEDGHQHSTQPAAIHCAVCHNRFPHSWGKLTPADQRRLDSQQHNDKFDTYVATYEIPSPYISRQISWEDVFPSVVEQPTATPPPTATAQQPNPLAGKVPLEHDAEESLMQTANAPIDQVADDIAADTAANTAAAASATPPPTKALPSIRESLQQLVTAMELATYVPQVESHNVGLLVRQPRASATPSPTPTPAPPPAPASVPAPKSVAMSMPMWRASATTASATTTSRPAVGQPRPLLGTWTPETKTRTTTMSASSSTAPAAITNDDNDDADDADDDDDDDEIHILSPSALLARAAASFGKTTAQQTHANTNTNSNTVRCSSQPPPFEYLLQHGVAAASASAPVPAYANTRATLAQRQHFTSVSTDAMAGVTGMAAPDATTAGGIYGMDGMDSEQLASRGDAAINRSYDNVSPRPYTAAIEGYKRVAWPPAHQERIVREFTPQPHSQSPAPNYAHQQYQQPSAAAPVQATPIYNNVSNANQRNVYQNQQQQQQPQQQQQHQVPRQLEQIAEHPIQYTQAQYTRQYSHESQTRNGHSVTPQYQPQPHSQQQPQQPQAQSQYQQCQQPQTQQYQQQPTYQGQNPNQYLPQQQQQQQPPHYGQNPNQYQQQPPQQPQHLQQKQQEQQQYTQPAQVDPTNSWKPIRAPVPKQENQFHSNQNTYPSNSQHYAPPPSAQPSQYPHAGGHQPQQYQQAHPQQSYPGYQAQNAQPQWNQPQQPASQWNQPPQQQQHQQQQHQQQPAPQWNQPQQQQQPQWHQPQQQQQQQQQQPAPQWNQPQQQSAPQWNQPQHQQQQYQAPYQAQAPTHYNQPPSAPQNYPQTQPQNQYNSYSQNQQPSQDHIDHQAQQPAQQETGNPGVITLRKETPVSQKPAPVYTSQPAAVSFQGGSKLRGDLKWPPPEYKEAAARENEERRQLALGPVCRPRRVNRDYTAFFSKHALNCTYPSYKVPPGTQHMLA